MATLSNASKNANLNASTPSISPPTTIIPFLGSSLGWPTSNNLLPMTNGHPSPPALAGNLASATVATVTSHSTSDSLSILATTSSNSTSKLHQLFDVFDCLFCRYCRNFYDYIQNHPNDASDYGSLSAL
ncbi:hypothetical protein O181_053216 [Austropuccinia psidii MF-1]|uniref:Uncharacterized protein n=1 Tax=Austropuccinia psidii MF-1 TaxID=1389203 RepID=A0A9Q3E734_9BASI|nr:hypothetical protein [Austropuccinia psidii MF-1]